MSTHIAIIGGGISGITTALTLQLLGYRTTVYTEYLVDDQAPADPRFASLYPAASIIPHSVQTDKMDQIFPPSLQVFQFLLDNEVAGMQLHTHYELFEKKVNDPPYARVLKNYSRIDELDTGSIPHRKESVVLSGWMFDCLVTEWPTYIQSLYSWYEQAGGIFKNRRINPGEIEELNGDIIINCSGIWSPELFKDSEPCRVVKGHLLYIKDAPLIQDSYGNIPSYNYTPDKTIYADPHGKATDVYFYPRSNGWILGGSRQKGVINRQGQWSGKENKDTISIDGVEIPRQIYELNQQIIKNTYGMELRQFQDIEAKAGYRYVRNHDKHGLRLEETKEYERTIIHNYGHGGAGVTLSWGCALEVDQLIKKNNPPIFKERLNDLLTALGALIR